MDPEEITRSYRQGQCDTVAFDLESASPHRLAETLAAFANSAGGILLLGVDPRTKTVRGIRAADSAVERALTASFKCEPPLVLPRPQIASLDGKPVLAIVVPAGLPHAYGVRGRFLVRSGKKTVILGPRQLRQLLRERGEPDLESVSVGPLLPEDLDSTAVQEYATAFLGEPAPHRKELVLDLLHRRNCLARDGTNLRPTPSGLLLFGREPQRAFPSAELILARYSGTQMTDQFLHQVAAGSLVEQIRRAEAFITANIRKGTRLDSFQRLERAEYPVPAVREAIVNAVAHRDYTVRGEEIRVLMFADRIEVYSPGRLPGHVTLDNIAQERFSRNQVIVQVLSDLGFVERLGYGIDRMIRLMSEWNLPPPEFAETANGFRVTLRGPAEKLLSLDADHTPWLGLNLNDRQRKALVAVTRSDRINNREYRDLFPEISEETVRRDLADLVEQGVLLKVGDKRGTFYILK